MPGAMLYCGSMKGDNMAKQKRKTLDSFVDPLGQTYKNPNN